MPARSWICASRFSMEKGMPLRIIFSMMLELLFSRVWMEEIGLR